MGVEGGNRGEVPKDFDNKNYYLNEDHYKRSPIENHYIPPRVKNIEKINPTPNEKNYIPPKEKEIEDLLRDIPDSVK